MATAAAPAPPSTNPKEGSLGDFPGLGDAPAAKPRGGRLKILTRPIPLLIVLLFAGAVGWSIYYFLQRPGVPPESQLQIALQHLDAGENEEAQKAAHKLEDAGYSSPEFPGGVAFILGATAFREAAHDEEAARDQKYMTAATQLKSAEQLTLIPERRPEWSFALGVSLHQIGSTDESIPLLQEAVETYPPGRIEAALMLADTFLLSHDKAVTEQALKLNTTVISIADVPQATLDRAYLQRAQILLALGKREEAETSLTKVSPEAMHVAEGIILTAQVMMRDLKFREAIKLLEPVAQDETGPRNIAAQASLLLGVCADRLGELDNALTYYQRTADKFENSHEALAARVGAAEAFLKLGRNEEALTAFAAILKSIKNPQQFRNRWLTLTKLRETVLDAWNAWIKKNNFAEAIVLSELMAPAIPRDEATELEARATHRWAEHLEAEYQRLPPDRRGERRDQLDTRWRRCGQAYTDLASTRQTPASLTAALWTAADAFTKGHDFASAAARYTELINTGDVSLVPQACVQRGQAYLNLDRLDEALADFQNILNVHPTDATSYMARYYFGLCQLERNQPQEAEKAWKAILSAQELAPTALEWRKALVALGRLHYCAADERLIAGTNLLAAAVDKGGSDRANEILQVAYTRYDEAIVELDEFCERYPQEPEALEARYLLAKAMQKSARQFQERLRTAETENTRAESRRRLKERLEQAMDNFQKVQKELQTRQAASQLDPMGRTILRNCSFDVAQTLFSLGRYDDAIAAYSKAVGRLQQHPEALLAYVQIANCYDRLKKPAEALSTLVQAKILLEQIPEKDFPLGESRMSKPEWQKWLDWAMKLHN